MANIQLNRKELEKHIKLDAKTLDAINLFGTPAKLSPDTLEIEVFPNRPDLLSLQGFVRAIKAYLGKAPGLKSYKVRKPEKSYRVKVDASVKPVRPYTVCAIVKNLKFDNEKIKEVIELQEKLHATLGRNRKKIAIGIYPLEKISLPIRYEARKPADIRFVPLESTEEMSGLQILQKHPAGRAYAHLLEHAKTFPVFVDSKGKILSMPPIINSHETGKITEATRDVFVECSGFDFPALSKALNILVTALADMQGEIHAIELADERKNVTPQLAPETLKLSLEHANTLLGLQLKEKELEKLLPRMGYAYAKGKVRIPAWRADVLHEVDIIEDIAIAYGYNNLSPELPNVAGIGKENQESSFERHVAETLVGLGFLEIASYHLIKEEEREMLGSDDAKCALEDSKSEYKFLRPNLMIPMLRVFAENKDREYPQKLFEMGVVFEKDAKKTTETGILEEEHLVIALSPGSFTEMKQVVDYLARCLGFLYTLQEGRHAALIEGRTAEIIIHGKRAGVFGEAHPATLRRWNVKMPVVIAELSFDALMKACMNTKGL